MIKVTLWRDEGDRPVGFFVCGHAGYRPRGQDIVCAAVSALAQAAVMGLEEFLSIMPEVDIGEGRLKCLLPENLSPADGDKAEIILGTLELGLKAIAESYGRFVQVKTRRCKRCW
jgi:uncharacterized protein YsxB (DUF464 family)